MKNIEVSNRFRKLFGGDFRFFSAPGRINIIGEHTDYNDGFVLPAAIDKRIYLAIAPSANQKAIIHSFDFSETVEFETGKDFQKLPHWAMYPYGVTMELHKAGYRTSGFKAVFGGDIPEGAGLSSSAALESAFALAFDRLNGYGLDRMTLAKTGQLAEHNYAGVRCGIMDQFASLHGKAGHAIQLDCRSLDYRYFPLQLSGYELILADTKVKHSLAASEYNIRRAQCEEGVMLLKTQISGLRSLRDAEPEDVLACTRMLGKEIFLRCEYVTEENRRVLDTCKALEEGDIEETGRLMYESHHGLRAKYDVSCDELDLLVDIASATNGVAGARMMGGGFGGCTINLVKTEHAGEFKANAAAAFREKFGKDPVFYLVNTGDGAMEIAVPAT
ncbi:MAG TPA: galactokinase [Lentimicrobium sp.]|nr:galactokinase [Lentimicrobium sp.]